MLSASTLEAYAELADWLPAACAGKNQAPIVGIQGAQGSGKSTLAHWLAEEMGRRHGWKVAVLSLDDCYHTRAQRQELARSVHPLLATRGVPGTHDVDLGLQCLQALRALGPGQTYTLPRFDKASDDRVPQGVSVQGPLDLILFEGWCTGLPAQPEAALDDPINALEQLEDPDGRWRRSINAQLRGPYAQWFSLLDSLIWLQVPDWEQVRAWRTQQEAETAAQAGGQGSGLMDAVALERFLAHYQRLTLHALDCMPQRADAWLHLDRWHGVCVRRLA